MSAALATVQASLVFTPYLSTKVTREAWAEWKYLTGLVQSEKLIQTFFSTH